MALAAVWVGWPWAYLLDLGDLDGLLLNDDHDLVHLDAGLHQLRLQVGQFLLHDGHLRRGRLQLLQTHHVTVLILQHLPEHKQSKEYIYR